MLWIVFSVLLALIGFAAIVVGRADPTVRFGAGVTAVVCLLVWLGLTGLRSLHSVPAGHVGVVYGLGRDIEGQTGAGLVAVAPWQTLKQASVQVQRYTFTDLTAFSKETQDVLIRATLNYQVSPTAIQELYREVGTNWFEKLVESRVHQIFKDESVKYLSVEIAPSREDIRRAVRARLERELSPFSVDVVDLLIENIDFRPEFKKIEEKQIATQQAQTEANRVLAAKNRAQQAIETAIGEGEAILERAERQAKANRLLAGSISQILVQWEAIQKLGPNVQVMLVPSDAGFLLPAELFKPSP